MVKSTSIKARSTTSKETANNKSSFSERRQRNSAYKSQQPILEAINQEVSGELVSSLDRFFDASLVPETCQEFPLFAKSDTGFDSASYGRNHPGASCPISSMAPVLAITGMRS